MHPYVDVWRGDAQIWTELGEDEDRNWDNATTRQSVMKTASKPLKVGKRHREEISEETNSAHLLSLDF